MNLSEVTQIVTSGDGIKNLLELNPNSTHCITPSFFFFSLIPPGFCFLATTLSKFFQGREYSQGKVRVVVQKEEESFLSLYRYRRHLLCQKLNDIGRTRKGRRKGERKQKGE